MSLTRNKTGGGPHGLSASIRSAVRARIVTDIGPGKCVIVLGGNPVAWPVDGYVISTPDIDGLDSGGNSLRAAEAGAERVQGIYRDVHCRLLQHEEGMYDSMVCVHSCYDIALADLLVKAFRLGGNYSVQRDDV